jgi:hypothetical protein
MKGILKIGSRVDCVFKESTWYGCRGTVVGFDCDGWIRVKWDDDETVRLAHPNDVEVVRMVEYSQYEKLRQEADDLHEENRKLTAIIEEAKK